MRPTRRSRSALLAALAVLVPAVLAPAGPALAGDGAAATSDTATSAETLEAPTATPAADRDAAYVPGRVLVGFRPGAAAADRAAARAAGGEAAIAALQRNPNVRYAEPDYLVSTTATSNDPLFTNGSLWGMYGDQSSPANGFGSQAAEAWAAGHTGSSDVYVVVIDEGLQTTHPDLADNVWTNPYDAVDGIDNDGNGFIDDVNGWDFVSNDNSVYDGSGDDHGTHVAGTIGAVGGNGTGVAGVAWDVTMISAKFLGDSGGTTTNAVRAVDYATGLKTRHGLNIVATSNSWGGGGFSQALLDAINRGGDAGILFVAAAGNSSSNNDGGGYYPSGYQCTRTAAGATRSWDCVVAVASTTSTGALSSFSSYGATTVDLGAPGSSIQSTLPGGAYGAYSGTSMATPHVSGAVALCAAIRPGASASSLRSAVLGSTAATASLSGKTVTGGRLDVGSMVASCIGATAPVSGAPSGLAATGVSTDAVRLTWSTSGVTNATAQEIQRGTSACSSFVTVATVGAAETSAIVGGLTASTTACFRVRAINDFSGGTQSAWSNTATGTTLAPPEPYVCDAVAHTWVDATSGGTRHVLADDASVSVAIGFPFPFYGAAATNVRVSSNGYVTFDTSQSATEWTNAAIPNSAVPNAMVAAFWDDLNPGKAGEVWTRTVGSTVGARRFVVSWIGVPHYSTTDGVTFQIVLDEATGSIDLNHVDTGFGSAGYDRGASATVGIETSDGQYGTQVSHNAATILDATSRRCATGTVVAPLAVTTSSLPGGTTGSAYSQALAASGGTTPYAWSLASGSLPAGLSLSAAGTISGTPTATGTATFTVRVTDAASRTAERALSIDVSGVTLSVTTEQLAAGTPRVSYRATLAAVGGTTPYSWSLVSGSLPGGLSLASTGTISGKPSAAGTWTFTVQARGADGSTATRTLTLPVVAALTVSTSSLPAAAVGSPYAQTLAASGGTAPYAWSLASGSLPAGLSLAPDGTISGTPSAAGSASFTVRVDDATWPQRSATRSLTITVAAPMVVDGLEVTAVWGSRGTTITARVRVADGSAVPLGSVTVTGRFTAPGTRLSVVKSATSGADGWATVSSGSVKGLSRGQTVSFCVTSLARTGYAGILTGSECLQTTVQ